MRFTGSQLVVEMLRAYGVRYLFGVPGDTGVALYDELRQAHDRGDITHVLARDERSAAYMADAYARISFRPGVCEGPSGAGGTYLAGGLAEAKQGALSKHLQSRIEVADILQSGPVPTTDLRAPMILGSGSASFEILRYLVERLPSIGGKMSQLDKTFPTNDCAL